MQISIVRDDPTAETMLGTLSVGGLFQCHTREGGLRTDRLFVPGESALPPGPGYNLSLSYCARYRMDLPLIASTSGADRRRVTDRIGMRLHPGHPIIDTGSEILLGQDRAGRTVVRTRPAFEALLQRIYDAIAAGEAIDVEIS